MSIQTERGKDFVEHFGVKGMRWGVRSGRTAQTVETKSKVDVGLRGKTKVKAKGGKSHPAHEDAVKAAVMKQKLKKSGPAALGNKELQDLQQRLVLEKNVKDLTAPTGKKFVTGQLRKGGEQQVSSLINEGANKARGKR